MRIPKLIRHPGVLVGLLSPLAIALAGASHIQASPQRVAVFPDNVPNDLGAPPRTVGGGTRGMTCDGEDPTQVSLSALMPKSNVATTLAANPTLYMYVPKANDKTAEFLMVNDTSVIIEETFDLTDSEGIAKLDLPVTLEPGEYVWQFSIMCDEDDRGSDQAVQGMLVVGEFDISEDDSLSPEDRAALEAIKEKIAAVKSELDVIENLPLREKAARYEEASLWIETLESAIELRQFENEASWANDTLAELLLSQDLEDIADKPFIDCCQIDGAQ